MHLPIFNVEKRPEVLHDFIRQNPLGVLTTAIDSKSHPFLQSSHIPWLVDSNSETNISPAGLGRLRGHIAGQNPQAKAMIESCTTSSPPNTFLERDVLVMFNGPVNHYVTPKFYKQTKPDTGKVVPTWDYEAVEVHGKARIYFDSTSPESKAFLAKQIAELSEHMETSIMNYSNSETSENRAWKVEDAPEKYIELLTKNIIGIEIEIGDMAGRFKWSQEKPVGDREGVIEGFREMGREGGLLLSEKVSERAAIFDAGKAAKKLVV